ncbi:MAG: SUF system NifU family Fe-S cluster assembly protein [Acidobacteriota bacterium]
MSFLKDLYQEVILDHSKSPRNFSELSDANRTADGYNPLCGDKVTVFLKLKDDVVEDVSFTGAGCAISTASASLMTQSVKGKTLLEAKELFRRFQDLVTSGTAEGAELGELEAFLGVSQFPVRVKCATLVWHTMQAALKNGEESVSTE